MKRTVKTSLLAVLSALLLSVTTGCGNTTTSAAPTGNNGGSVIEIGTPPKPTAGNMNPVDLALVLAVRKDMPPIDLKKIVLLPVFQELCMNGGSLNVVISDGDPARNIKSFSSIPAIDPTHDDVYYQKELRENLKALYNELNSMEAKKNDAAVLDAVNEAVSGLKNGGHSRKYLIVADNGISTAKSFNMDEISENADMDKFVQMKEEQHMKPDMNGIETTWYGIGKTSTLYEDPLSKMEQENLKTFWTKLLSGNVRFDDSNIENTSPNVPARNLPDCKCIQQADYDGTVPKLPPPAAPTDTPEKKEEALNQGCVVLDTKTVAFAKDSSKLEDVDKTKEFLKEYADQIIELHKEILIIGAIATVPDSPDQGVDFSLKRARSVKNAFIELGIPESMIHIAGAGFKDNRITDPNDLVNGKRNEELSQQNRKVIIYDINTDNQNHKKIIDEYFPQSVL